MPAPALAPVTLGRAASFFRLLYHLRDRAIIEAPEGGPDEAVHRRSSGKLVDQLPSEPAPDPVSVLNLSHLIDAVLEDDLFVDLALVLFEVTPDEARDVTVSEVADALVPFATRSLSLGNELMQYATNYD